VRLDAPAVRIVRHVFEGLDELLDLLAHERVFVAVVTIDFEQDRRLPVLVDDTNLPPRPVVQVRRADLRIKGERGSTSGGERKDRPQRRRLALRAKGPDVVAHGRRIPGAQMAKHPGVSPGAVSMVPDAQTPGVSPKRVGQRARNSRS
jgi:hypothetical protein